MKVLFLTGRYPSKLYPTVLIFAHNQAKGLIKEGIDVHVLEIDLRSIRRKRRLGYSFEVYDGVPTHRISIACGPIPNVIDLLGSLGVRIGFKKVLKEWGLPDIIHAHFGGAGILGLQIKKIYDIPVVLTEHGSNMLDINISEKNKNKFRRAYPSFDRLIAVGKGLKKSMGKLTDRQIEIIPNLVPSNYKIVNKTKNSKFTFISVGNLVASKRFDMTIKAFASLSKQYENIELWIIGQGVLNLELQNLATSNNILDKIKFLGIIENKNLPELYNKCHCFVLPSEFETFGVVYIEAAACGLPIIATKCGGPEDIVNINNGILIEKSNEVALFDAMKYMYENLENEYDFNIVSLQTIKKYGEAAITVAIKELYQNVLDKEV